MCVNTWYTAIRHCMVGALSSTALLYATHLLLQQADESVCVYVCVCVCVCVCVSLLRLVEVRFNDPWRQEQEFRSHGGHCSGGQGFTPRSWMVWPGKTSPPAIVGGSGGRSHRSSHRTHP